jgi:hypothetical protein
VNDVRELFPLPLFNGTIFLFPMIETGYESIRERMNKISLSLYMILCDRLGVVIIDRELPAHKESKA